MVQKKIFKIMLLFLISGFYPLMTQASPVFKNSEPTPTLYPQGQKLYDRYPNSVLYYYGVTVNNPLIQVITLHQLQRWPEHIQSIEFAHTLSENNALRRFFSPLVGIVQLAAETTVRTGNNQHTVYEFDPYIGFRWANLPWNQYVATSFALGEGVSYASSIPAIEKKENNNTKRLLNYLMIEATFASPRLPRLQFVARIHHRSGAYGLYHAGNTGSNDVGVGIRYLFD